MITSIFLNLIYLFVPLLCYYVYLIYNKVTYEKEKNIFFLLSLLSSLYLCLKFGSIDIYLIAILNILFIFSLLKKDFISSIILSVFLSFSLFYYLNINLYALIFIYFATILFRCFLKYDFINVFAILNVIASLIVSILFSDEIINFENYPYILIYIILMYFLCKLISVLYKKLESIVSMYQSFEEITKEKTLYQSLFKITHEIKNPLAVCKGYLEMFDIRNTSKANKYINIIDQEIDRTLVLLKDFQDVSKLNIDKNEMDIKMLLEDVCDESKMIFNNNIVFDYNLSDDEVYINGDYNRLKQVLINVIKNAKESIKESGRVSLKSINNKTEYVITISDNGSGMDDEMLEQIGTPFYTTKKNGTGLGVCFSKEIVERHGGKMKYESKKNEGTTVKIILPTKKASI